MGWGGQCLGQPFLSGTVAPGRGPGHAQDKCMCIRKGPAGGGGWC